MELIKIVIDIEIKIKDLLYKEFNNWNLELVNEFVSYYKRYKPIDISTDVNNYFNEIKEFIDINDFENYLKDINYGFSLDGYDTENLNDGRDIIKLFIETIINVKKHLELEKSLIKNEEQKCLETINKTLELFDKFMMENQELIDFHQLHGEFMNAKKQMIESSHIKAKLAGLSYFNSLKERIENTLPVHNKTYSEMFTSSFEKNSKNELLENLNELSKIGKLINKNTKYKYDDVIQFLLFRIKVLVKTLSVEAVNSSILENSFNEYSFIQNELLCLEKHIKIEIPFLTYCIYKIYNKDIDGMQEDLKLLISYINNLKNGELSKEYLIELNKIIEELYSNVESAVYKFILFRDTFTNMYNKFDEKSYDEFKNYLLKLKENKLQEEHDMNKIKDNVKELTKDDLLKEKINISEKASIENNKEIFHHYNEHHEININNIYLENDYYIHLNNDMLITLKNKNIIINSFKNENIPGYLDAINGTFNIPAGTQFYLNSLTNNNTICFNFSYNFIPEKINTVDTAITDNENKIPDIVSFSDEVCTDDFIYDYQYNTENNIESIKDDILHDNSQLKIKEVDSSISEDTIDLKKENKNEFASDLLFTTSILGFSKLLDFKNEINNIKNNEIKENKPVIIEEVIELKNEIML